MVDDIAVKDTADIKSLKFNYDILCLYKHSGSYALLAYALNHSFESDAIIAMGTVCMVLLHQYAVVVCSNQFSTLF